MICQLYTYDENGHSLDQNTAQHFAKNFSLDTLKIDKVKWLNYHSVEFRDELSDVLNNLEISSFILEDIYKLEKRPKVEEYTNCIFFKVQSLLPENDEKHLNKESVSFILGDNFLITTQEQKSGHFNAVRDRIENKKGKLCYKGADYLLFRLLDAIIDNYFEVIESNVKKIQHIEKALAKSDSSILSEIEIEKRKIMELKKMVFLIKDVISHIERLDSNLIKEENFYYFSELKDECLTILDEIDTASQMLDGLSNLFYAIQGQRMNEIMKMLTLVSTIFIPITFIAGIYGMNFRYMPELDQPYGYYTIWGIIVATTVSFLVFFKKKGWLKNGKDK
jgi:magnesium transporter